MATNNFTFVGKIAAIKDSEKFHPIERKNFTSGWTNTTVKFNVISNGNRIMCMTQGGKWADDSKNSVKTFSKTTRSADNTVIKGEKIEIPWEKRFDDDEIDKVAGFKRYVVDLGDAQMRYKLMNAVKAFEDGTITDDLIEITGCKTIDEAKDALEKSNKRRHVFITEWDFAEFMTKVVVSEKIKNTLFRITGYQDVQYSAKDGRFYVNYCINRVEIAKEELEPATDMNIDFYFAENCIDESMFDETGKAFINGWTTYYDNNVKATGFMPMSIVLRDEKKIKAMKRKLDVEDSEIQSIGFVTSVIDGTDMVEITEDDLDEETKLDIECGLLTLEDALGALGKNKAGDRITEIRFKELNAHKSKSEETTFTIEDMKPAVAKTIENDLDDDEL